MFGYWFLHGSLDWLWEFAGLSGPALLGLGLAMATGAGSWPSAGRAPLLRGRLGLVVAACLAVPMAAGIVLPWLAARDVEAARTEAGTDPVSALDRLDRAASLNPLSPIPDRTAGLVRVRRGELAAATNEFEDALRRTPRDAFSTLMLAAIASHEGNRAKAGRLMQQAGTLAPRWSVLQEQERLLRRGRRLDPRALEGAFRADIQERIGPQ
jgi:tetratricopeptide (TPR) repeat protein